MKRAALPAVLLLAACSGSPPAPDKQEGAHPALPEAQRYLLPPMKILTPVGWKQGEAPIVPAGFTATAFADHLNGPRNVYPLPNGDVLAIEAGTPVQEPKLRPKDWIFSLVKGRAKSAVKPGNRIVLLRDTNGDGKADQRSILIDRLKAPFGVVLVGNTLYVAETNRLMAYAYTPGATTIADPGRLVTELPMGEFDHHYTKSLTASADGSKLYVGIGSNSNVTERGMTAEQDRARIWEVDPASGATRPYATGLRNPNGLTFNPATNQLWAVVNERDELGNNLVPDYMTSVRDGGFYGWPWSWYGHHVDVRVMPKRPDMVAKAIVPDYALGPHVAALGLAFGPGATAPAMFPARYAGGAFVGEHGSWDRDVINGYQIAFVPFAGGKPVGKPEPFVSGFVDAQGKMHGRPVGVAFDGKGALLIADDTGNVVWRVTYQGK
jgi:glucose/arabinose dehydrogenase